MYREQARERERKGQTEIAIPGDRYIRDDSIELSALHYSVGRSLVQTRHQLFPCAPLKLLCSIESTAVLKRPRGSRGYKGQFRGLIFSCISKVLGVLSEVFLVRMVTILALV